MKRVIRRPMPVACPGCDPNTLKAAVQEWNGQAGQEIFSVEENDHMVFVEYVDKIPPMMAMKTPFKKMEDDGRVIEGFADYDPETKRSHIYILNRNLKNVQILAHELGHTIGFQHSRCDCSIMYPEVNICSFVTKEVADLALTQPLEMQHD